MNSATPAPRRFIELRRAAELLRGGRHAAGRALLAALLRDDPALFDAHWLLSGSYAQNGEFTRAQKELRACVRLQPRNVDVYVLLGRVLFSGKQIAEAERTLRRALELDHGHLIALALLGRLLLAQARTEDARRLLEPCVSRGAASTEVLMLYGHASITSGLLEAAAGAYRTVVAREPENADARLRLAAVLVDRERGAEAETEARVAIAKGGMSAQAGFVLGRALSAQGRFDDAEMRLREVVRAHPDHLMAQSNLSELVWMRTGDVAAAAAELDSALQARPDLSTPLFSAKARLWMAARQPQRALETIEMGLARVPDEPALLEMASDMALQFDGALALVHAQRLVRVAPNGVRGLTAIGKALLATGRAREALAAAERVRAGDRVNGEALALYADALRMMGDARYRELLDYRHFVRADRIDVPDGWNSLAEYLADLARELAAAHTLKVHPVGNSLREGSQVALAPALSTERAIHAFSQAIDGPIKGYMQALGTGTDPMRWRNTGAYRLSGTWSVRLRANGFHVNHYHPQGWLSSACYIDLPRAVERGGEGWLKFGEPAFPTAPPLGPEYFLKPEPGLLALFPSYMWHGTVPFSGSAQDSRLTIAFDVIPN